MKDIGFDMKGIGFKTNAKSRESCAGEGFRFVEWGERRVGTSFGSERFAQSDQQIPMNR
jgi:hypothetical protein